MLARVARFEFGGPEHAERVLSTIREAARQRVAAVPGWRGVVQLLDPSTGEATVVHFLEDEAGVAAAEEVFAELDGRLDARAAEALRELDAARRSVTVVRVLACELERLR